MRTNHTKRQKLVIGVALVLALTAVLMAGELEPWAPPGGTMKQLDHIEPRTALHSEMFPVTISAPGSYYLTGNVTAISGIAITANDVTIDLNGFTLEGTGGGSGIQGSSLRNITIRNGTVRDWGTSGIELTATANVMIERVVASNNAQHGILSGFQSLVIDCRALENGRAGIAVDAHSVVRNSIAIGNGDSTGEPAILAGSKSVLKSCVADSNSGAGISAGDRSLVAECATDSNVLNGIEVGAGGTVTNCVSGSNHKGIHAGHGSVVRNCTIRENRTDGIFATYGVEVSGNNCSRNGSAVGGDGAGIYVEGVDNRIDGNLVLSNDRGIETAIGGNIIIRNSASGNGTDYDIAGGNDLGPIGAAVSATSPWANVQF
jgi:parallel beta-helix repeat protein